MLIILSLEKDKRKDAKTKEKNREPERDQTRKTRDDKPRDRRTVTDIVTTTVSVTEIEEGIVGVREIRNATVTKAVTDRVKLRLQKKKKIRGKTKDAKTMQQKKQSNTDSDLLAVLLYNKIILFPCNLHAQF